MERTLFPLGELPSLVERAGLPLPRGVVPAGASPAVAVAAVPAHPSNVVQVQTRRGGAPAQVVRATPQPTPWQEGSQWFHAGLPTVERGSSVDYRVELMRAGRRLATIPADGSWLTVTGERDAAAQATGVPRWGYDLTFFAALTVDLRAEVLGATPEGYRINFHAIGGRVTGPRIDAVVHPEGGDWMCIRPDGVGLVDIRITYETRDGALILERAGGVFDLGPDGYAKVVAGRFTGSPPFYATPTWSTAHPSWRWLNRCQGFGVGRVVLEKLQVQCDIHIPRVLDRLSGG